MSAGEERGFNGYGYSQVDGCIAVCFADLMRNSGFFSREEADEYMSVSCWVIFV